MRGVDGVDWPEIRLIRLDRLSYPGEYQRDVVDRRAKAMAERFDPELFDPLTVVPSEDDGERYWVTDGCHRWRLAEFRGLEEVPCRVVGVKPIPKQAKLFHDAQKGRKGLSSMELWKAAMAGTPEDFPDQHALAAILHELDYEVGKGQNMIEAVASLLTMFRRHGERPVVRGLIAARAWQGMPKWTDGTCLCGLIEFFARWPDADDDRLDSVLSETPPMVILATVNPSRMQGGGIAQAGPFAQEVKTRYNKTARGPQRLK